MFEKWFALDPGSHTLRLYDYSSSRQVLLRNLYALDQNVPCAFGKDALSYIYREKPRYQIRYPMIPQPDPEQEEALLDAALEEIGASRYILRPAFLVALDEKENPRLAEAWSSLLKKKGARKVVFRDPAEFLQMEEEAFMIHAGFSSTRLIVACHEKLEKNLKLEYGGYWMAQRLIEKLAREKQVLISAEDALALIEEASRQFYDQKTPVLQISGMDRYQKIVSVEVRPRQIWDVMDAYETRIVSWSRDVLESFSDSRMLELLETGIFLSGGLGHLYGLKERLEKEFNAPVHCSATCENDLFEHMKGWR